MRLEFTLPIRTPNPVNGAHRTWKAVHGLRKKQRGFTGLVFRAAARSAGFAPTFPLVVTLTRVAPSRGLDDDNLRPALKSIRDQVAAELGVDDGDTARVRFEYQQQRGPWGVRVEIQEGGALQGEAK